MSFIFFFIVSPVKAWERAVPTSGNAAQVADSVISNGYLYAAYDQSVGTHSDWKIYKYGVNDGYDGWTVVTYNGTGNTDDHVRSVTTDGPNLYVAGCSIDSGGAYSIRLNRYDSQGNQTGSYSSLASTNECLNSITYYLGYIYGVSKDSATNKVEIYKWPTGTLSIVSGWPKPYQYGTAQTEAYDIAANVGGVYITGFANVTGQGENLLVAKFSLTVGAVTWVYNWNSSGASNERGSGLALDTLGNIYVAGYTNSGGTDDYLIVKVTNAGTLVIGSWPVIYNHGYGTSDDRAASIKFDLTTNRVYVSGWVTTSNGSDYYTMVRRTDGGSVTGFGPSGKATGTSDEAKSVEINGSIVYVTGTSDSKMWTITYTATAPRITSLTNYNPQTTSGGKQILINDSNFAPSTYKQRPIDITNSSGTALANYTVLVDLSSVAFSGEVSFFDSDLVTYLKYYAEGSKKYSVTIPSIGASGTRIYVRYNGGALWVPPSDAAGTFALYDDFEQNYASGSMPDGWQTYGSGEVQVGTDGSNKVLKKVTNSDPNGGGRDLSIPIQSGVGWEASMKIKSLSSGKVKFSLGNSSADGYGASVSFGTGRGRLFYGLQDDFRDRTRAWNGGTSFNNEVITNSEQPVPNDGQIGWEKLVNSPKNEGEYLAGRIRINGTGGKELYAKSCTDDNCIIGFTVPVASDEMPIFDLAYEASSGEGLAVWRDSVTNTKFDYRIWNGTSWGTVSSYNTSGNAIQWVKLIPNPANDTMALIWSQTGGNVGGVIWNGSSFINASPTYCTNLNNTDMWSFDAVWDFNGSKLLVACSSNTSDAATPYLKTYTYAGGTWSMATTSSSITAKTTAQVQLFANPSDANKIGLIKAGPSGTGAIQLGMWNGSTNTMTISKEVSSSSEQGSRQNNTAGAWLNQNQAIAVYTVSTAGDNKLYYSLWNTSSWSNGTVMNISSPMTVDAQKWIQVERLTDDNVMVTVSDGSKNIYSFTYTYNVGWALVSPYPLNSATLSQDNMRPFYYAPDQRYYKQTQDIEKRTAGVKSSLNNVALVMAYNTWYKIEMKKAGSNLELVLKDNNGAELGSVSDTNSVYNNFSKLFIHGDKNFYVDDIRVRPYAGSVGSEGVEAVVGASGSAPPVVVKIGGENGDAATVTGAINSQITATAPPKPVGFYDVYVQNPDGSSEICVGCMEYVAPPSGLYIDGQSPDYKKMEYAPADVVQGSANQRTIKGTGYNTNPSLCTIRELVGGVGGPDCLPQQSGFPLSSNNFKPPSRSTGSTLTLRVYGKSGSDQNGIYTDFPNAITYVTPPSITSIDGASPDARKMEYVPVNPVPEVVFDFDEGSGSTTSDSSGTMTGTLANSPIWVDGQEGYGKALRFDGYAQPSDYKYVSLGPDDVLDDLSQGTIMAWVKPAVNNNTFKGWFQAGKNGQCLNSIELAVIDNQFAVWGGTPPPPPGDGCIDPGPTLYAQAEITDTPLKPFIGWHHLAYVVNNTSPDIGFKLYIDGTAVTPTFPLTPPPSASPSSRGSSSSTLFFAQMAGSPQKYRVGATEWPQETFNGLIDDFRIYDEPLSAVEILAAMSGSPASVQMVERVISGTNLADFSGPPTSGSVVQTNDGTTKTGFNLTGKSFSQTEVIRTVPGDPESASVALTPIPQTSTLTQTDNSNNTASPNPAPPPATIKGGWNNIGSVFNNTRQKGRGDGAKVQLKKSMNSDPGSEPPSYNGIINTVAGIISMATDDSNNVYIATQLGSEAKDIKKYSPDGALITEFDSSSLTPVAGSPTGIAVTPDGNYIYVLYTFSATDCQCVKQFELNGTAYQFTNKVFNDAGNGGSYYNIGLAVDDRNEYLYVVDNARVKIHKFRVSDATEDTTWGSGLSNPHALVFDSTYTFLYLMDTGNNRVVKFTTNGVNAGTWPFPIGTGAGQIVSNSVYGIALDEQGNMYLADRANRRIQKFNSSGAPISQFGNSECNAVTASNQCYTIAIDPDSNIYVGDYDGNDHRIYKYKYNYYSTGTYTSYVDGGGGANHAWKTFWWDQTLNLGSTIAAKVKSSDSASAPSFAGCDDVTNGASLVSNSCVSSADRYLWYQFTLNAGSGIVIPNPIDTAGDVGRNASLAIGLDGYIRIAYWDMTNGYLKFIQCTNTECSTNNKTTLDSVSKNGFDVSMVIGSDGYARIAYWDYTVSSVKFIQCTNADCSTKNINTVDSSPDLGNIWSVSLALNSNNYGRISYHEYSNGNLKFAQCTNASCSTKNITIVDSAGDVGFHNSIAVDSNGYARIAYWDRTNGDLKFAQCTSADCSTKNITIVDSTDNPGSENSIAIGSYGNARIAYYEFVSKTLKFAQCTSADCSTKNITTVDSVQGAGWYTSIAIGADGYPRIAYHDHINDDLKFAQCTSADCSTKNITTVDSVNNVGQHTSLAIGADGNVRIAYFDFSNKDLKLAFILSGNATTPTLDEVRVDVDTDTYPTDPTKGIFTSGPIDIDFGAESWGDFSWNPTTQPGNSSITMQARSCVDSSCYIADSWGPSCSINNGGSLSGNSCVHVGHKYIQYQATLTTTDISVTPSLDDVTINYSVYGASVGVSSVKVGSKYAAAVKTGPSSTQLTITMPSLSEGTYSLLVFGENGSEQNGVSDILLSAFTYEYRPGENGSNPPPDGLTLTQPYIATTGGDPRQRIITSQVSNLGSTRSVVLADSATVERLVGSTATSITFNVPNHSKGAVGVIAYSEHGTADNGVFSTVTLTFADPPKISYFDPGQCFINLDGEPIKVFGTDFKFGDPPNDGGVGLLNDDTGLWMNIATAPDPNPNPDGVIFTLPSAAAAGLIDSQTGDLEIDPATGEQKGTLLRFYSTYSMEEFIWMPISYGNRAPVPKIKILLNGVAEWPKYLKQGRSYNLTGQASYDPEPRIDDSDLLCSQGGIVNYVWDVINPPSGYNGDPSWLGQTFAFTPNVPGLYKIKLTVTDRISDPVPLSTPPIAPKIIGIETMLTQTFPSWRELRPN
ncbi:hypothetical protein A3I37_04610 [Candidatus Uhrbacteria bacterium RIFCSPLOWO2_02_FULL_46_19]|nr:MAG: hypothetical protein A3I37_04610 [Candidatus Uhrbacteria bacterium RIFCSPLOWO2_02_FULL_46_19]